ncbi:MAG: deoxyribodipyrimidine photolyase, partial [Pirellulaceae bacterium]
MEPIRVPPQRVRPASERPVRADGEFVLYWMIANRRGGWNFSLERAVEWAVTLQKPLVILEALRCDYRWASDRLHTFIIEGMAANDEFFRGRPVEYYPYVEPTRGAGKGLLERLSQWACVVVTDDFPSFFLPRMVRAAVERVATRLELVDSNGLLPLRAADKVFARAFDFRRFLQQRLLPHLGELPSRDPLAGAAVPVRNCIPVEVRRQWPRVAGSWERLVRVGVGDLPLDHTVRPAELRGGWQAAQGAWDQFLRQKLPSYALARNQPDRDVASGLSPYLHFGHISVHQLFDDLTRQVGWTPADVHLKATGSASGWWGASAEVEAFLDELITWRELGYNMCWQCEDYDQFASLPAWARQTLAEHASDPRPRVYELAEFEASRTHDPLWNAAQR